MLSLLEYKNKYGKPIKEDGILGDETKNGIRAVFGIECENMNEKQIIEEMAKVTHRPYAKKNTDETIYNLEIRDNETNEIISNKAVTQKNLNNELSKLSCSVEQICLEKKMEHGSLQFTCNSYDHNISVNISTEGKFEFGITTDHGNSAKLSIDKDGKLKISTSDSKLSNSVSVK